MDELDQSIKAIAHAYNNLGAQLPADTPDEVIAQMAIAAVQMALQIQQANANVPKAVNPSRLEAVR